jgi:hypothetical protein
MGNFYTDAIRKDARFASLQPIHDLALLEPVTRSKVLAIIADAAAAGIKLMPTRPAEARPGKRGSIIRGQPSSKPWACITMGSLATWSNIAGEPSWKGDFAFLGRLAKKHKMIWGGDWGSPGARHKFVDSVACPALRCTAAEGAVRWNMIS